MKGEFILGRGEITPFLNHKEIKDSQKTSRGTKYLKLKGGEQKRRNRYGMQ